MTTATISQLISASPPISGGEIIEIERDQSSFKISLDTLRNWISEFVQQQVTLTAEWQFDDSTTASDPGNGKFRLDNITPQVSASNIYIDDLTENDVDFGRIISRLTANDIIYIQEKKDSNRALLFEVSGVPTDNTGWWTIPVQNGEASLLPIRDGEKCGFIFNFSG